jgi:hypothetical protein
MTFFRVSWVKHLFRSWFAKHRPIETRKNIAARRRARPMLEMLEDRLAPAAVSYNSVLGELDFVAGAGETIAVTAPASHQIKIQLSSTSDTITLGGGASSNANFTLSLSNSTLTISNVNNGLTIDTFNVDLANQQASPDTLTFGLGTSSGVENVNIGAVASSTLTTDSPSGVSSGSATVTPATMEPYITANAALLIQGGQSDQEVVQVNGTPTSTTFNTTFALSHSANFTIAPAVPQTDTGDTVSLTSTTITGSLSVSAESSLNVQSAAVPVVGAATINAAPTSGPFTGDQYITGPAWASYGYVTGDTVGVSGVSGAGNFTIAGISGDNLYLSSSSLTTGSDSDVTVQQVNFTPVITANTLTVNLTGAGSAFSGAISATNLSATTNNGDITLEDISGNALDLQTLNAGTAQIQLSVSGSIESAASLPTGAVNLTAGSVDLYAALSGSSIGPLTTNVGFHILDGVPHVVIVDNAFTAGADVYRLDQAVAAIVKVGDKGYASWDARC